MNAENRRDALLHEYVAIWERLDGFLVCESLDDCAEQFALGDKSDFDRTWKPVRQITDPTALELLYAKLPARFPPLFEQLLLTYRWTEVDLRRYRIHGNPLGDGLLGFLARILKDKFLSSLTLKSGFIPFGKGGDMDYDPVCFNLKARKKNREFEIVKLDHEEILCNERIRIVATLAPSFETLVMQTIESARAL